MIALCILVARSSMVRSTVAPPSRMRRCSCFYPLGLWYSVRSGSIAAPPRAAGIGVVARAAATKQSGGGGTAHCSQQAARDMGAGALSLELN